jgi:hypothetical protein
MPGSKRRENIRSCEKAYALLDDELMSSSFLRRWSSCVLTRAGELGFANEVQGVGSVVCNPRCDCHDDWHFT